MNIGMNNIILPNIQQHDMQNRNHPLNLHEVQIQHQEVPQRQIRRQQRRNNRQQNNPQHHYNLRPRHRQIWTDVAFFVQWRVFFLSLGEKKYFVFGLYYNFWFSHGEGKHCWYLFPVYKYCKLSKVNFDFFLNQML